MNTMRHFLCILSLLAGSVSLLAGNTNAVPISSVPFFISKPGNYKLTKPLNNGGNSAAIIIGVRDVVLDLNGFALVGSENVEGNNVGVLVRGVNAVIRNGTIRKFDTAIADDGATLGNTLIEDVICTNQASAGVRLAGDDNLIRRVTVRNIGQKDATPDSIIGLNLTGDSVVENCLIQTIPSRSNVSPIAAIRIVNSTCVVRETDIHNVGGIGILIGANLSTVVERVRIRDCSAGISTAGPDSVVLRDSTIRNNGASTVGGFVDGKGNSISN
jgi:hypothetical protein